MEKMNIEGDDLLVDIMTDYIEGNLDHKERIQFERHLDLHPETKNFVNKAKKGRTLLQLLVNRLSRTAEDFEARLALKIALSESEKVLTD